MPVRTRPLDPDSLDEATRDRFYAKVAEANQDGCQLWLAATGTKGYGHFGVSGRGMVSAHRVAYVLANNEDIPAGRFLDHVCRVRRCVNPQHLRVVTNQENLLAQGSQHWARTKADQELCSRGHPLTEANLLTYQAQRARPRRQCRACQYAWNRLDYRRRHRGLSWTEEELQREADSVYAARQRTKEAPGQETLF